VKLNKKIMKIDCIMALQHLELINNHSKEILDNAVAGKDLNKELERIKGYMTNMSISSEAVRDFLVENKSKLEDRPPLSVYRNKV